MVTAILTLETMWKVEGSVNKIDHQPVNTVLETGIYNLTQDQTPVLCHFGLSETKTYMMVRLPEPEHEPGAVPANPQAASDAVAAPAPADVAPSVPADSRER